MSSLLRSSLVLFSTSLVASCPLTLSAADPGPDKSAYTLANPTPTDLLRELGTDRPDTTESPFTVDAGHLQLEMDLVNVTANQLDGTRTREWGLAPFNLRLGLLNQLEAGIFVSPAIRQSETPRGGPTTTHTGFGDITLRTKFNFWGNDGGENALGLIADLTLPSSTAGVGSDRTEGDLILPVAFDFGSGWDFGAMTVAEFRSRSAAGGYRLVWTNSATLGHALTKTVDGYIELVSTTGDGSHVAAFDFGVTWKLTPNLQLDAGANLGLTRAADDVTVFTGLSRRF